MIPGPFEYHAPTSLDEALALLAEHGEDAKVLAGGQSLIPLMRFRLAQPARLVDLRRVPGLGYIEQDNGTLRIWKYSSMKSRNRLSGSTMDSRLANRTWFS